MHMGLCGESLKGEAYMEDSDIDGRIMLKWVAHK